MNAGFQGTIKVGDRLTDYSSYDVEVKRIASGGFGVVYLGPDHLDGGTWAALKTLRPDVFARSKRAYDSFVREGLTWVGLWPHANLLTAQTVTIINNQPFLVLNYAQFGSLRDLFTAARRQGHWLPPDGALSFAQQIAAGLVALHTPDPTFLRPFPLVHRDLKPENILIEEHGYAKITDFGLAKVGEVVGEEDPTLLTIITPAEPQVATRPWRYQTARGMALGTLVYMAPEQWADAATAGPPVDVYAFGLILGELLTGQHALLDLEQPHSEHEWREAHRAGQPRSLASLAAQGTPPEEDRLALLAEAEGFYQACLAKQAEARPSASEALTRLREMATQLGQAPYIPPEVTPHAVEYERIKWNQWANTCYRFGLYEEALARNDRARALAPTNPAVLLERGNILAALGRPEEALIVYDQTLVALAPDDSRRREVVWNNRGARLSELGRYAEAEAAYAQALALIPDDADTWDNQARNQGRWANAEEQAGHADAALTHWRTGVEYAERAVKLNPHNPQYQALLSALRDMLSDGGDE